MSDLLVGLGLVLVIEGFLGAAFPRLGIRMLEAAASTPEQTLRLTALVTALIGIGIVYWARS